MLCSMCALGQLLHCLGAAPATCSFCYSNLVTDTHKCWAALAAASVLSLLPFTQLHAVYGTGAFGQGAQLSAFFRTVVWCVEQC